MTHALDDMAFKFKSILQTCMKNDGYDFLEREICHKNFLLQAFECADFMSLESNEKVKNCYDRL